MKTQRALLGYQDVFEETFSVSYTVMISLLECEHGKLANKKTSVCLVMFLSLKEMLFFNRASSVFRYFYVFICISFHITDILLCSWYFTKTLFIDLKCHLNFYVFI